VQEVYRLQGVKINDKHIGVIDARARCCRRFASSIPGDRISSRARAWTSSIFRERNERVVKKGDKPATSEPFAAGITKASLTTQSFISAASFQRPRGC